MKITIIREDKLVGIDGKFLNIPDDKMKLNPSIRAIRWFGTYGEIENIDGTIEKRITDMSIVQPYIDLYAELYAEKKNHNLMSPWDSIRQTRDQLLYETDWTMLQDSPLSDEVLNEWKEYRTSLRNITKQFNTPGDVIWPKKPS